MLKINKMHRRTLRVVFDDYNNTYEELLASHNDISIHQKHLKHLPTEVYKFLANLNPEFMWPFFKNNSILYNLRNGNICILPPARSPYYGINSVRFGGSLLWNNFPISVKKVFLLKNSNRNWIMYNRFPVLVLMMMMSCFCGMVDRRKAFNFNSSRDHCQRSSPSRISDMLWAGFEPS